MGSIPTRAITGQNLRNQILIFYYYTIRNYKTFSVTLLNTEALKEGKIKVTVSTIMNKGSLTFIIVTYVFNDNFLKHNTVIE